VTFRPKLWAGIWVLALAAAVVSGVYFVRDASGATGALAGLGIAFYATLVLPGILLGALALSLLSLLVPQSSPSHEPAKPPTERGSISFEATTPLLRASVAGDLQEITALLADGASVDERNALGQTALMGAALGGHAAAVRLLLDAGADRDAIDALGRDVMVYAEEHPEVIRALHATPPEAS